MKIVEEILIDRKNPGAIIASSDTTVMEAAKMMAEADVSCVVVRDEREPKGIVTEHDMLQRVIAYGKEPRSVLLGDVMSSPVKTCRLSDGIDQCARMLIDEHFHHLVVVEGDRLVDLITLSDVLRELS